MTRRDRCYYTGKRAGLLKRREAANAWAFLASHLEDLGRSDMPKFIDLLAAIRRATIIAKIPKV